MRIFKEVKSKQYRLAKRSPQPTMEQQAPYRAVPNTASSEKTRPLRVLLATVGNSDRGQNPVAPLPGLRPY